MTPRTVKTSIASILAALCVWAIRPSDAKAACVVNVNDRGAIANDAISDSTAIQNAITAAQNAGGGDVCFGPGRYRLSAAIQWTVGSAFKPIGIVGVPGATILSPDAAGTSAIVVAGVPYGSGGVNVGHFNIRGITVSPYPGVTPATDTAGIILGQAGTNIDGALRSAVSNVRIERFRIGLRIRNLQRVQFDRVLMDNISGWGVEISPNEALPVSSTSDLTFNDLDVSLLPFAACGVFIYGQASGPSLSMQIKGLRFNRTTVRNGGLAFSIASVGSRLADIRLTDTMFTSIQGSEGISVSVEVGSYLTGLQIVNGSFESAISTPLFRGIHLVAWGSGVIENTRIAGGTINNTKTAIDVQGRVRGISLSNLRFKGVKPEFSGSYSSAIHLRSAGAPGSDYPRNVVISGNTLLPAPDSTIPSYLASIFIYPICSLSIIGNTVPSTSDFTGVLSSAGQCPAAITAPNAGY